jgi:hypothetical protein
MQTTDVHTLYTFGVAALFCLLMAACSGDDSTSPTPSASVEPTGSGAPGLPGDRVTFYGADLGDQAGAIVAGDFNGDGVADIALGAAFADGPDNQRPDAGEAYVFLGPFVPGSSRDAGLGDYDFVFYGARSGDTLSRALLAGDFNDDGTDDLAMGAPAAEESTGLVYVMFGGTWPTQTDFAVAAPGVLIRGGDDGDFTGLTLAAADLDNDSSDDLLISAMLADGPQDARADAGEVYLLPGSTLLVGTSIALEETPSVLHGARAGDRLGEGLATGDVNGDGSSDLVLVATFGAGPDESRTQAGQTYVILSPAALPIDLASGGAALEVIGADPGDQLGHSMQLGDTDGDGATDIWLGAVSADGPGNAADLAGEAVLVTGKRPPGTVVDTAAGQANAIIYGPEREARLGRSLTVADVSGDGLADLAIAAPNLDSRAGRIFFFYGGSDSYPGDTSGADSVLYGLDPGDTLGHEAAGTPPLWSADVDGDGRVDLLLSAPSADGPDNNRIDSGEAYVIPGVSFDVSAVG